MDVLHKILTIAFKKGISDKELCEKIGVYNSAISEWKKGKTQSYMKHLDKIAFVLGVSVSDLIETEQKEKQPTQSELSEKQKRLIKIIEGMSDDQLDRFEKILAVVETTEI